MDNLIKEFDELKLSKEKSIIKHLSADEQIVASFNVFKYNEYLNRQERTLMITNKCVYNLKNHSIKRVIPFPKIEAITVAYFGSEFVIHVPSEYDYRYYSLDKIESILLFITQEYVKSQQKKLKFFFKEEISLQGYWTTKANRKKANNLMPQESPFLLDYDGLLDKMNNKNQQESNTSQATRQQNGSQVQTRTSVRAQSQTIWTNNQQRKDVCLEDFQLLKVLGGGAFGKVLLVEDKQTQEWFAMKVIKKQVIIQNGKFEHTKTEKAILEHVNFPFLVNLVYAFQDNQHIFFVMQFLKGGELYQYLKRDGRFTESRTKFYIAQLILALGHLHSKNIIYRDLKLENIVMDSTGYICLTDFGLAKKIIHQQQIATTFCGTAEYLSPEILKGDGQDFTADWWALGIICYELLYGNTPFHNKNAHQMFEQIKYAKLEFKNTVAISNEAKDFIEKCLTKDKTKRLGAINGQSDVQAHPWFNDIDFNKLLKKEYSPEFVPVTEGMSWISNFDKDFTKLSARITNNPNDQFSTDSFNDIFKDF
ncbi:Serine/Threonine kinase domain protein (macronuclear) [Tetrahymena thermophila SB210]|uniref:Serine/Threonine kinase domain protein n=1 Tax=Tetrahymena thermophila (strain SB210) TaxID=312017 RepID=I7LZL5_TETTS|nr:Serine/Threonine kinase domain protein [Tetrahymena thermophila SB210]EAR84156.1 Serine/Threonine kinase domain protein [Tetrahymena thermophila SB210]|eukprot:XP_001031819.1 Serine/Threonine kinase domain protein [Tetrahymena thermophila SB210]